MSSDLEQRLRAALAAAAELVIDEPVPAPSAARPAGRRAGAADTRRRRFTSRPGVRTLAAAGAALVLMIAGLAIGLHLRGSPSRPAQPVQPPPSTSMPPPSSSSSGVPAPDAPVHAAACAVPLPGSWQQAIAAGAVQLAGPATLLAIGPSGDALAYVQAPPHGELVLISPDRATRVLYQLPATMSGFSQLRIGGGQLDAHWAMFTIIIGAGEGSLRGIYAVGLATGEVRVARSVADGSSSEVPEPVLLDGRVYWNEHDGGGNGAVYSYDLAAGVRRTLDTGQLGAPGVLLGQVYWAKDSSTVWASGAPTLPPGFELNARKVVQLVHDGTTYAWGAWEASGRDFRHVVKMIAEPMRSPAIVYPPPSPEDMSDPVALTGPYLLLDDMGTVIALDTRTGATTVLEASDSVIMINALAANGVIALAIGDSGSGSRIAIVSASQLPGLNC